MGYVERKSHSFYDLGAETASVLPRVETPITGELLPVTGQEKKTTEKVSVAKLPQKNIASLDSVRYSLAELRSIAPTPPSLGYTEVSTAPVSLSERRQTKQTLLQKASGKRNTHLAA